MEGKFIAYLRVSTDRQGRSGLGLEAQRGAVAGFLNGGNWELLAEYVEVESGKRKDRPQLRAALDHARNTGATLVFARLDRLTRNTRFLLELAEANVPLRFCDFPELPAGPVGKMILTMMASTAEYEAALISQRTKDALAAAKARGVKLGNPNGAAHLRGLGNDAAVEQVRANANAFAEGKRALVAEVQAMGVTSLQGMAQEFNRRGVMTARGGAWHATSIKRLLGRLGVDLAQEQAKDGATG